MKKGFTQVAVVLDRSGSMGSIKDNTIEGFNAVLREQKETEGEVSFTLAQFDDEYELVYNGVDIKDVPFLNSKTYNPRGRTALYDAVSKTIDSVGESLRWLPESKRPEKVVFIIVTDGHENASNEFSYEDMTYRLKHQQEKYNWQVVYIGANQDAMVVAQTFNIPMANAMTYTVTPLSTRNVFLGVSKKLKDYRTGESAGMSYTSVEREEQESLDNK